MAHPIFLSCLTLILTCTGTLGTSSNVDLTELSVCQAMDNATIHDLLTAGSRDPLLLQRLETCIADSAREVAFQMKIMSSLPKYLSEQLKSAKIDDIETFIRVRLQRYHLILQEIRVLHSNATNQDNKTFLAFAANIQTELDKCLREVRNRFPNKLYELDSVLRKTTIATDTEGFICDVSVAALNELKIKHNLTSSVRNGPVAMVEAFASLQKLATDLLLVTCGTTDPICTATVVELRQNIQRQRDRLEECIPPWVVSLAKNGVVSGLLQTDNKAVTQVEVYYSDSGQTNFYPELHDPRSPEEGSQQQVVLQESNGHLRLVLGKTCFVSLSRNADLECLARSTSQDALFAVETSRDGSTWLWNVQTQRYLVAGVTQERCREGVLGLSQQRGSFWTFDSSFNPGEDDEPLHRECRPPSSTPDPTTASAQETHSESETRDNGAEHSCPGLASLALTLMTLAFAAARAVF